MSDNILFDDPPRFLTPTERERLMGFPDGWTAIPKHRDGDGNFPDAKRNKALGNSWGVNAAEFVLDRIRLVDELKRGPIEDAAKPGACRPGSRPGWRPAS